MDWLLLLGVIAMAGTPGVLCFVIAWLWMSRDE